MLSDLRGANEGNTDPQIRQGDGSRRSGNTIRGLEVFHQAQLMALEVDSTFWHLGIFN